LLARPLDLIAPVAACPPAGQRLSSVRRACKTAGLDGLLERARGEVIVFSSSNSMYRLDAIVAPNDQNVTRAMRRFVNHGPELDLPGEAQCNERAVGVSVKVT